MPRTSFNLGSNTYPLGHLNGFRVTVPAKDPLVKPALLQVTFSCHVHSEKWDDDEHDAANRFTEDGQDRAFCPVRYGCSINLEQLIRYHVGGKAYWGRDSSGKMNSFFYAKADGIAYPIYFSLGRADRINLADGLLHVISAYQNPELPAMNRFQAIKFARLVHQTCAPKT